ncbi:UDP-glycosyltransferase UGT5-like [Euwallacea fornicatus]|uniref:UDP-glycosyltransferase UGT5-like n=1 Tax=Euwallacea fornicatus TaxID=995702 RepID=UPI00338E765C
MKNVTTGIVSRCLTRYQLILNTSKSTKIVFHMMLLKAFAFITVVFLGTCENARILGVFPMGSISHQILAYKLMKGLAEAGHDVTMVSTSYPHRDLPENGTYTEIILDGHAEYFEQIMKTFDVLNSNAGVIQRFSLMLNYILEGTNMTLNHPKVKQLINSGKTFDLFITEYFLNEPILIFSHIFNCPMVLLNSLGITPPINTITGNPQPISYISQESSGNFNETLSFIDRLQNLFVYVMLGGMRSYYLLPKQNELLQTLYPNSPSVYELLDRVELVLLNSHISTNAAVHLVPNMVEIGGYFVDPPKPLPSDLQNFMDGAQEGVIYFSLGSNAKSKDMAPERKEMFFNVFRRLKEKVIWKFEEDLPHKPENVLIQKWCPQQDILAHPNVKLFITHGGLLSTTETIYHGVPILAIPIFADQPANAARAVAGGYGLSINYKDNFTEAQLDHLVHELLHNPKYRENAQKRAKLYHDRIMKPMETAVYWMEHVIRHGGVSHLKVAGIKLPWYKYYMMDVIVFLALIVALFYFILKVVVQKLLRSCQFKKQKSE